MSRGRRLQPRVSDRATPPLPRKSGEEWAALLMSWGAGLLWAILAFVAVGGVASYPFDLESPCPDALTEAPVAARLVRGAFAVAVLVGGGLLASLGVRNLPQTVAARRAMWVCGLVLVSSISPVPFLGGGLIALPYVLGLSIRGGRARWPAVRWIVVCVATVVITIASAYWLDATQCL